MNITKKVNAKGETYYRIRVSDGYRSDGTQIVYSTNWKPNPKLSEEKNEKALHLFAADFENRVKHKLVVKKKLRFEDVCEAWFELAYAQQLLKESTLKRYKQCKPRIYEAFADRYISTITQDDIATFITKIGNTTPMESAHSPNEKLSRKTQSLYINVISNVFKYALQKGYITENPCHDISLKRAEQPEITMMSVDEMSRFMTALQETEITKKAFFTMAAFTGLRRGELLALKWRNISFEEERLYVVATVIQNPDGKGEIFTTPKTKNSRRYVYLHEEVIKVLNELKEYHNSMQEMFGSNWNPDGRLFVNPNGMPVPLDSPRKWLKRFCRQNNISDCTIHSFRHFFTSLLLSQGVDIATISKVLGHSMLSTTMNVYSHCMGDKVQQEAIKNAYIPNVNHQTLSGN